MRWLGSFMAKVEKVIEARVDARLAASSPARRRQLDAAILARRRLLLKHMAVGSVVVAIPFSFVVMWAHGNTGGYPVGDWTGTVVSLVVMWVLITGVYVACAFPLRSSRHDRDES
jgi:uncharacterized membrane protein YcjF (UPF0283 family)